MNNRHTETEQAAAHNRTRLRAALAGLTLTDTEEEFLRSVAHNGGTGELISLLAKAATRTSEAEGMYIATVTPSEGDPAAVAAPTLAGLYPLLLDAIRNAEFTGPVAAFIDAHPVPDDPAQAEEWLACLNAWPRPTVVTVYDPYQVRTIPPPMGVYASVIEFTPDHDPEVFTAPTLHQVEQLTAAHLSRLGPNEFEEKGFLDRYPAPDLDDPDQVRDWLEAVREHNTRPWVTIVQPHTTHE